MSPISVFGAADRKFESYLGDEANPATGRARIARMIGQSNSSSLGGGVVVYEQITVDWDLPFDEMITVIEGEMMIRSDGKTFSLTVGDVAWFPARTPLTYVVTERATVSYAIWPLPN